MKLGLSNARRTTGIGKIALLGVLAVHCYIVNHEATGQSAGSAPEAASRPTLVTVAPAGIQRFAPDAWSSLSVVGVNPTDQDSEEVVSVFLAEDAAVQFSRRMWVPANSKRQAWLPFHISKNVPRDELQLTLSTMRLDQEQGVERFAKNSSGEPVRDRSVMLAAEEINTALIGDARRDHLEADATAVDKDVANMIYAARDVAVETPLDLSMVFLTANFMPRSHRCLDELDQLVIAGDQLLRDPAGIETVRQWLHRGGRLWIMVDQTDPQLVDELLGDDSDLSIVDRVELNEFELEITNPSAGQTVTSEPWSSERPATLVRVVTEIDEIAYRINGWPAAAWKTVGRGEVLLTTLEPHGWGIDSAAPTIALTSLAKRFFEPRQRPFQYRDHITPILENQIGYAIPSRSTAAIVLGANVIIVLCFGVWWMLRRTLERLAFLIPCSAVLSAAVLFWIGKQQTQSVPSTIATGQVVQSFTASPRIEVSAFHAVYSQNEEPGGPVSKQSVVVSSQADASSQSKRIQWNDAGASETLGDRLPPGVVRHYQSSSTETLQRPMKVRGSFDRDGFVGRIEGVSAETCEDAVAIEAFNRASAIKIDSADEIWPLRCGIADLLPADRYASGAFLSEEQRLRQEFVQAVFREGLGQPFGASPNILLWTKPFGEVATMPASFKEQGASLAAIPIEIQTPPPGTDFRIPATFIGLDLAKSVRGTSTVFNPRTGQWMEDVTKSKQVDLRFSFPRAVAEMSLKQVNVHLKINAPSRNVIIKCRPAGSQQAVIVHEANSPTGIVEFAIDDDELLGRLDDGGWWMQIGVTQPGGSPAGGNGQPQVVDESVKARGGGTDSDPAPFVPPGTPSTSEASPITWTIQSLHIDAVGRIIVQPGTNSVGQL